MKTKLILSLLLLAFSVPTFAEREVFRVQAKYYGHFIINNIQFTARENCPIRKVKVGDPVFFPDGSPYGRCLSAVFVNLRNGVACNVWCN